MTNPTEVVMVRLDITHCVFVLQPQQCTDPGLPKSVIPRLQDQFSNKICEYHLNDSWLINAKDQLKTQSEKKEEKVQRNILASCKNEHLLWPKILRKGIKRMEPVVQRI